VTGAQRLRAAFAGPGKALVAYVTAGDPSLEVTAWVITAAAAAGATVIELGVPFSEPTADGVAIQRAMGRALAGGVDLAGTLAMLAGLRAGGLDLPVVLFGYYNPIFVRGVERFCDEAAAAGVDGVLVVDQPLGELDELAVPAARRGLGIVPLAAPTSGQVRLAAIAALDAPFTYYVSMTGVTGGALTATDEVGARVSELRAAGISRIAVGFGIATPDDARRVAQFADGVVVGTAIVRAVEEHRGREAAAVGELVGKLAAAIVRTAGGG
jgi:tryptophan synthase alpha chain